MKEYYKITATFEFEVKATNEDDAMEQVDEMIGCIEKLSIENISFNIDCNINKGNRIREE
tara:strand:+ start:403 stop:582 length:180 start_codon:yes stop_codon:yes gene_type:complete